MRVNEVIDEAQDLYGARSIKANCTTRYSSEGLDLLRDCVKGGGYCVAEVECLLLSLVGHEAIVGQARGGVRQFLGASPKSPYRITKAK
jgi:hypothetical protein